MQGLGRLPGLKMPTFTTDPDCGTGKPAANWRDLMPDETYRTTIGHFIWRRVVQVMLSLQVLVMLVLARRAYVVEEALAVMLVIAIAMAFLLLVVVAIVLIQALIRQGILWMTIGIVRLAKLRHRHVSLPDPIIPPPL
jgi:hypothetical protein